MEPDSYLRQLLIYLFAGSRGAEMRMRIILALAERPANTNQLANDLGVDYKAIQYQLDVLMKNKLIETPMKQSYGALYFLTPIMQRHLDYVREIWSKYGKSQINKKRDET
ncbi:MAG: winged helix-turn-helix transcriptional regulator [Thaumarchaeota archaeon]|nr:winged helix-turn-helix transcriptional regulator [Nitrososphaerota archaeon]